MLIVIHSYHRVMKERGVDFILCPAYVGAAPPLATAKYWLYTAIWNILDQPAAIFPTGLKVDPELDPVEASYTPRSKQDEEEYRMCKFFLPTSKDRNVSVLQKDLSLTRIVCSPETDSPEKHVDAPIALQVVGKHFRDEDTVAAAELISKIVRACS